MADSSSDDDMLRLLQIQTIAGGMQMRRKKKRAQNTLLHAVDIRAAKTTRRLTPVGEIIGTWGL